ncbi:iron-sulfur cluster assembly protein [Catenulispora yoronensis]
MATRTIEASDLALLEAAASAVPDPELPVVTLGDLGIVRGVAVADDGAVEVRLTPTFVGCPATEVIAADVRAAVEARLVTLGGAGAGAGAGSGSGAGAGADTSGDAGSTGSAGAVADLAHVEVRTRMEMSPAWSTDWISDDGRRKLAEHGIAPPRGGRASGIVAVTIGRRAGLGEASPLAGASPQPPTPCPRCGSTSTRLISAFGSTPCQSLRACRACGEPFGAMKAL